MTTLEDVLEFIELNQSDEKSIREINKFSFKYVQEYRNAKKLNQEATLVSKEKKLVKTKKETAKKKDNNVASNDVSIQAVALAKYMAQEVKKRYSWYEPRVEEWAKDIEKIHRLGCIGEQRTASNRFDWATIKAVTLFSQQDEFWQQQVRSGANLRKHFNKLLIKTKKFVDDSIVETI